MKKPINLDYRDAELGAFHVWSGAGGTKVFVNGPTVDTRHMEFADSNEAINWFFGPGYNRGLSRAIHAHVKSLEN